MSFQNSVQAGWRRFFPQGQSDSGKGCPHCAVSEFEGFQASTGPTCSDPIDDPAVSRRLDQGLSGILSSLNDFMILQCHKMLQDTVT